MDETWVFSEMKIKVVEWVWLQYESGEVSHTLEGKQLLNKFKELLRLEIDRIEIKQLRWQLVAKLPDACSRALPKRHELGPFAYEVNCIHDFGSRR
jgi:hypothetical protein